MSTKPNDMYLPETQSSQGPRILFLTANNTHDLEFFYPYYRLIEEGFAVDVATPDGGEFQGKMGMGLKQTKALKDVRANDYVLLYIPGGKAPAELMKNDAALKITREFAESGKPIAAICHGPQVLATAGVIQGKKITAWPECEAEVEQAGATYQNSECVSDGNFITARWPADLPAHMKATLKALQTVGGVQKRVA